MKSILVVCSILALCAAEAPLSGPYPAAGFRPKGPQFLLPGELDEQSKQTQEQEANVEINKEQVDFAGSTTDTEQAPEEPFSGYLPPADAISNDEPIEENTDGLRVQGLPGSLPEGLPQGSPQGLPEGLPQGSSQGLPEGLPQGIPAEQEEVSPFSVTGGDNKPSQEYGPPKDNQLSRFQLPPQQRNVNFNRQRQQQFGRLVQQPSNFQRFQQRQQFQFARQEVAPATPAPKYGVPKADEIPVEDDVESDVQVTDDNGQASAPAVEAAKSGRYYVLSPDNTLQRVRYQTFRSADDRRSNGFSAKLRYMPVEPIRDPVYAYNEQGVLVRVYRK